MKYMLLIYEREQEWSSMNPAEQGAMFKEYGALSADLKATGKYIAGAPLEPTTTATTVRVRNGAIETTNGPFAETREQLGGYYLVDARDLDEALAIAARIPTARNGSIEVRPVLELGSPAAAAKTERATATA